jgi:4-hydroxy-tetrahydrodipicolinate reductase
MSDDALTAVQYGVGPIGSRIVEAAHRREYEFVGAVDVDPEKVGRDLGDVASVGETLGVTVTDESSEALATDPDVVFHSTVSSVRDAKPQLEEAISRGANVVSTTEELAYPWWSNPDVAEALDATARNHGVSVLGTGINPGFVMDAMPAVLSTPMESVESVTVTRVQDAAGRRAPLQRKVGAGLAPDRFESEIATSAGHVGSTESVAMLADALEVSLEEVSESIEPVIAETTVETDHTTVEAGAVAGIRQTAHGYDENGDVVVTLDLQLSVGAEEPRDHVDFDGVPDVTVTVDGGFHGDVCTSALVANVAPSVVDAPAGLRCMTDVPVPSVTARGDR